MRLIRLSVAVFAAMQALLAMSAPAPAVKGAPATDIFVAALRTGSDGPTLGALVRATDRPGYDNQPAFLPDGKAFLYSSIDAAGQADIYRYVLDTGKSVRVTYTPESEFSPTPMPDGSGFAVVRVEEDNAQRLWAFDNDGTHPRLLRKSPADIGYFAWTGTDPADVLAMLVQKPLVAARLRPDKPPRIVARNPGRCFRRIPAVLANSPELSLVVKYDATHWDVMRYDPAAGSLKDLVATPEGSEDFAWTPAGWLIMPGGQQLLAWRPGKAGWQVIADLRGRVPGTISRLAISGDGGHIAFVVARRHMQGKR